MRGDYRASTLRGGPGRSPLERRTCAALDDGSNSRRLAGRGPQHRERRHAGESLPREVHRAGQGQPSPSATPSLSAWILRTQTAAAIAGSRRLLLCGSCSLTGRSRPPAGRRLPSPTRREHCHHHHSWRSLRLSAHANPATPPPPPSPPPTPPPPTNTRQGTGASSAAAGPSAATNTSRIETIVHSPTLPPPPPPPSASASMDRPLRLPRRFIRRRPAPRRDDPVRPTPNAAA